MKQTLNDSNTSKQSMAIIGGGISGLMSGILALKENFEVTIFEKNKTLGGAFKESLDLGYANNYILIGSAYDKVRKNLNDVMDFSFIFPKDTSYIYMYKGNNTIHFYKNMNLFKNDLIEISPFDLDIIEDLISGIISASKLDYSFSQSKKFIFLDKDSRQTNSFFNKYGKKTILEYCESFKNEDIKKALCNFVDSKNSICLLMLIYGLFISNRLTMVNNPSLILDNLINEFIKNGGKVRFNSEVRRILNKRDGVSIVYGNDDIEEKFDKCMHASDWYNLYENLINKKYQSQMTKMYVNKCLDSKLLSSFVCTYSIFNSDELNEFRDIAYLSFRSNKKFRVGCKNNDEFKIFVKEDRLTISFNQCDDDYEFFKLIHKDKQIYKKEIKRITSDIEEMLMNQLGIKKLNLEKVLTPIDFEKNFNHRKGGVNGVVLSPDTIGADIENEIKNFDNFYISSAGIYRPFWFYSACIASKKAIEQIKKYNNKE